MRRRWSGREFLRGYLIVECRADKSCHEYLPKLLKFWLDGEWETTPLDASSLRENGTILPERVRLLWINEFGDVLGPFDSSSDL